jgi:hypothetical protein
MWASDVLVDRHRRFRRFQDLAYAHVIVHGRLRRELILDTGRIDVHVLVLVMPYLRRTR